MSDAIEGAEILLYGVSQRYKESANVSRQNRYLATRRSNCASDMRLSLSAVSTRSELRDEPTAADGTADARARIPAQRSEYTPRFPHPMWER